MTAHDGWRGALSSGLQKFASTQAGACSVERKSFRSIIEPQGFCVTHMASTHTHAHTHIQTHTHTHTHTHTITGVCTRGAQAPGSVGLTVVAHQGGFSLPLLGVLRYFDFSSAAANVQECGRPHQRASRRHTQASSSICAARSQQERSNVCVDHRPRGDSDQALEYIVLSSHSSSRHTIAQETRRLAEKQGAKLTHCRNGDLARRRRAPAAGVRAGAMATAVPGDCSPQVVRDGASPRQEVGGPHGGYTEVVSQTLTNTQSTSATHHRTGRRGANLRCPGSSVSACWLQTGANPISSQRL